MATQTNVLTFDGTQPLDGDQPYIDVTLDEPYASASAYEFMLGVSVADGEGPITIEIKESSKTTTGFRVLASAQFDGTATITTIDV